MTTNNFTWMIGGPQGSGINVSAETLAKACVRGGLHVFANIEYHSNIKGEHSYYRLRIADHPVGSHLDPVNLLVALDKETLLGDMEKATPTHNGHRHEVTPGGGIIYDPETKFTSEELGRDDVRLYPVPYMAVLLEMLKEQGKEKELSKFQIMKNTVALGATVGLVNYDFEEVAKVIRESFMGRKAELGETNVSAAKCGYDYVKKTYGNDFEFKLERIPLTEKRILMRGVQAVGIAKLKAGCAVHTYYPITPATDESEFLESHQKQYPIVVVQTEDEIAAINMATGAAHAGARASTSTSGPGFSLMAEGLGWAGITEAPGPVLILYQRAGPSTGLPTRHEQGDLRFALHASHGEFPRMVMAPGNPEECIHDTFEAFNLAERYQVPVIVLADKHLASSYTTMPPPDTSSLKVDRGAMLTENELAGMSEYKRYAFTETGISPRTIPGQKGGIFWTTGDEHTEFGHITENSELRIKMMDKRMHKLDLAASEIPEAQRAILYGSKSADVTLVSWGSTKGAILDAMEVLNAKGMRVNFLQVRYLIPFPAERVREVLEQAKKRIIVEDNYSAQLAGLIREHTGVVMDHQVVKFNGRPFSENEIVEGVEEVLRSGAKRVVMAHA